MKNEEYRNYIKDILKNNFDLYNDINLLNRPIDVYGKWSMEFGRNFLTKNTIIDKFECNEHCIIEGIERLDKESIEDFTIFLKQCTHSLVKPHIDHKTTYITGVIVSNEIDENLVNYIRKFKYVKNYKFSLYGWSSIRLIVVDLKNKRVMNNKIAKEFAESIAFHKVEKIAEENKEVCSN